MVNMGPDYFLAALQAIGTCGTYPGNFLLNLVLADSYEDITTCGTYPGNRDVTLLGPNSYAQIATCGTYPFRPFLPPARFVFSNKSGVAPNILWMVFAVLLPVLSAGAIGLLLLWVEAPKVISILRPPALIRQAFLVAATLLPATSFLSLFKPRVWCKQAMAKRTPPPRWHKDFLPRCRPRTATHR